MSAYTRSLKQKASYWANPVNDGFGGKTFDAPVNDLPVRWEHRQELFLNPNGEQVLSKAVVYLDQDVDPGEYLLLGASTDTDPTDLQDAYMIRGFEKVPNLKGTEYVRKAWL